MTINIVRLGTVAVAGTVAGGLLALPIASFASGSDDAMKRDEDTTDVVVVDDEDDDDTNAKQARGGTSTGTRGDTNTGTGTGKHR